LRTPFQLVHHRIEPTLPTSIAHMVGFERHEAGQVVDVVIGADQEQPPIVAVGAPHHTPALRLGTKYIRPSTSDAGREHTDRTCSVIGWRAPTPGLDSMPTSAAPGRPVRHNLPAPVTRCIGREGEVAAIRARLEEARLLTLTGVGGCGKTRVALEVADAVIDQYADGVWLVELNPLADAALVPHSVAAVLHVRHAAGQTAVGALTSRLRGRQLLLVLDNCEHLLEACAALIDALLRACPDLRVLATSREPLRVNGEIAWRVPSLAVPDPLHLPPLIELQRNPAVELFVERARAVEPRFSPSQHNAAAVAEVCARLDGIPLALELAAARVSALPVSQLAARLDQRFRLLTGGSRAGLPRHRTLRAALDWSYDLLSEPERHVFERLAVFSGGCSLEAAEAVCAGDGIELQDVLDLLSELVDKSLVVADVAGDGTARYRLLETMREYARERLASTGTLRSVARRHAEYFVGFVAVFDTDHHLLRQFATLESTSLLDRLERDALGRFSTLRATDAGDPNQLADVVASFIRQVGDTRSVERFRGRVA
jgi:predicted ATPase